MKLRRKSALIEQDVYPFVNVGGSAVLLPSVSPNRSEWWLKEEEQIIIN